MTVTEDEISRYCTSRTQEPAGRDMTPPVGSWGGDSRSRIRALVSGLPGQDRSRCWLVMLQAFL